MTEDEIRELLASLPLASMIPTPPTYVAILRRVATDAGAEGDELDGWVKARGGTIRHSKPVESRGLRRGQMRPQTIPGEPYYVLPAQSLKPAK